MLTLSGKSPLVLAFVFNAFEVYSEPAMVGSPDSAPRRDLPVFQSVALVRMLRVQFCPKSTQPHIFVDVGVMRLKMQVV